MATTSNRAPVRRCAVGALLALSVATAACVPPPPSARPAPAPPAAVPTTTTTMPAPLRDLVAIQISGASTLVAGTVVDLTATGLFSDGSTEVLAPRGSNADGVHWSSSDTTVVAVDNASGSRGATLGVDGGTATVTVSRGAVTATAELVVTGAFQGVLAVSPSPIQTVEGQPSADVVIEGSYLDAPGSPAVLRPVGRWAGVETLDDTIAVPTPTAGRWVATGVRCGGTSFLVSFAGAVALVPVWVGTAPLSGGPDAVAPAGC